MVSNIFIPGVSFNFPILRTLGPVYGGPVSMRLVVIRPRGFVPRITTANTCVVGIRCRTYARLRHAITTVGRTKVGTTIALGPRAPVSLLRSVLRSLSVMLLVSMGPNCKKRGFVRRSVSGATHLGSVVLTGKLGALVRISNNIGVRATGPLLRIKTSILITNDFIFHSPSPLGAVQRLGSLWYQLMKQNSAPPGRGSCLC